ncbi:Hypothetical predicted protein, partial [Octopus vulgaris]
FMMILPLRECYKVTRRDRMLKKDTSVKYCSIAMLQQLPRFKAFTKQKKRIQRENSKFNIKTR